MRFLLFLVVLLSSMAARADKLHFEAYSIATPPAKGWLVTRGGVYDIAFGAALTPTHTWAMSAAAIPLAYAPETLLDEVRQAFVRDSDPARFRIVRNDGRVERLNGATCARLSIQAEDGPHFVIEAVQVTCIHPSAPGLAIEVGYHERYLPGESSGAFNQAGEHFIRSVRFWRPAPGHRLAASPALPGQGR